MDTLFDDQEANVYLSNNDTSSQSLKSIFLIFITNSFLL